MDDLTQRVDDNEFRRISDFLYDEAELLAERLYQDWIQLLAQDVHYVVPVPEFFEAGTGRSVGRGNAFFDDNLASLKIRTELLGDPTQTTAENPPSQMSYFVSNIRPRKTETPGEIAVTSRLLIYRIRATEPQPYILAGRRNDLLREDGESYKVARREVRIHQASVQAANLSFIP